MSERSLGCHCDLEPGQQPTGCVFDGHEPVENCSVAMRLRAEGKSQAQCEHWKPVQPSEMERLRAEVASLRLTDADREALERLCEAVTEYAADDRKVNGEMFAADDEAAVAVVRALLARLGGER